MQSIRKYALGPEGRQRRRNAVDSVYYAFTIGAFELYVEYVKCAVYMIRKLSYPDHKTLRNRYRAYVEKQESKIAGNLGCLLNDIRKNKSGLVQNTVFKRSANSQELLER